MASGSRFNEFTQFYRLLPEEANRLLADRETKSGRIVESPFNRDPQELPAELFKILEDRRNEMLLAQANNIPAHLFEKSILERYNNNEWFDEDGYIDAWQMVRANYPKKRRARTVLEKGDVEKQKRRYREKLKTQKLTKRQPPSGRIDVWIEQLGDSIAATDDPERKEQLRQQIRNLEKLL